MMRKTVAKEIQKHNKDFKLRGAEVKRIEAFSDVVFALLVRFYIFFNCTCIYYF